ncbi:cell wall glucanase [Colletotrichum graminicola]|uniref:Cell wall glucanase n=1 Tax=Colletotrichum graminicola (strain M1.001 / M2 / FGSC 10212) TaxID=645133 RepID=E3QI16_COLGM|nr:cell wall glucanase [Colletotrichum graminicola M1.001]EFQ30504.1 cell wall glucanase [Colletotrichum graminicola M1.001]WDK18773.1 cell wall glucanase [Colletotrichum graminicola]
MKPAGLSSALVLILVELSAAHPQGTRDVKGSIVQPQYTIITESSLTEPIEAPQVIVYVDEKGAPLETATETVRFVPASRSIIHPSKPLELGTRSGDVVFRATSSSSNDAPGSPLATSSTSAVATSSSSSSSFPSAHFTPNTTLPGIAYAPYTATGQCKTAEQMDVDFAKLEGKYSVVRTYGTDCNQIANALPAAKKAGVKLFLGIFDISSIPAQVATIVSAVSDNWSLIDTVSVGNELVNNGKATAQQMVTAVGQTRQLLRAAGYTGPVVTVDTFVAVLAYPELCDASDYCAMNIHPFFDSNTAAKDAGSFITRMVGEVQSKLSDRNKRIVCTETGWPWKGNANGAAIPGIEEQQLAVDSIKKAYASHMADVILFSAFNDLWKHAEAATFNAEQYWGIGALYSDSGR